MRELKFRMYIGENLGYIYSESIGLVRFFELAKIHNIKNIEQSTGLLDKKGKEIYEGDIIKAGGSMNFSNPAVARGKEREVYFMQSGFTGVKVNNEFDKETPNSYDNWDNYTLWNVHRDLEIIGNIHENKELLK
jgi:uncharacterized phage protein (TIGR01671 family)